MDRRRLIAGLGAATAGLAAAAPALARDGAASPASTAAATTASAPLHLGHGPRSLKFRHLHTMEDLEVVYWENGDYVPESLAAINHLLRDFRSNEVHEIDRNLLDLLYALHRRVDSKEPYRIISAYRSPATNGQLTERSGEVAVRSLHMEGQAVDVRLVDVALTDLRDAALRLGKGGVGYYPDSDFVHLDVGRPRRWQGT